jgi:hypothetical protein
MSHSPRAPKSQIDKFPSSQCLIKLEALISLNPSDGKDHAFDERSISTI